MPCLLRGVGREGTNMKYARLLIVSLLFAGYVFGVSCPIPDSIPIPFPHDTNSINYRVVATVTIPLGSTFECDLFSCDPDPDNMGYRYALLIPIIGMNITPDGHLVYTPVVDGEAYADVEVTDMPPTDILTTDLDDPNTDTGTIVFRTIKPNQPPVFEGCGR